MRCSSSLVAKELWQAFATREAELFVRELGIDSLPVKPTEIAEQLGIEVGTLPSQSSPGVSGMLLRIGNHFGILYSTSIDSIGFKNFSIGHELGHYRLPGHPESILQNGMHASYAGFRAKDRFELEADHFSAGMLMPSRLSDPALNKVGDGLDAVLALSERCETSLPATAIRYAQRSSDATAIIVPTQRVADATKPCLDIISYYSYLRICKCRQLRNAFVQLSSVKLRPGAAGKLGQSKSLIADLDALISALGQHSWQSLEEPKGDPNFIERIEHAQRVLGDLRSLVGRSGPSHTEN